MALSNLEKIRIELQDTEAGFYILDDDSIEYFLSKNNNSIQRAALDCAKTILLKLSMQGDESVDIFSIRGSKVAEQYRLALKLYISDPNLNPILNNVRGWVGGVSLEEMQANRDAVDNNIVSTPNSPEYAQSAKYFDQQV